MQHHHRYVPNRFQGKHSLSDQSWETAFQKFRKPLGQKLCEARDAKVVRGEVARCSAVMYPRRRVVLQLERCRISHAVICSDEHIVHRLQHSAVARYLAPSLMMSSAYGRAGLVICRNQGLGRHTCGMDIHSRTYGKAMISSCESHIMNSYP